MPIPGIVAIKHNGHDIVQIWRNGELYWSSSILRDDYTRDDLGGQWTHYPVPNATYRADIVNGALRMDIPDGLIGLDLQTDRVRFNAAQVPQDDYYAEFRIGSQGSGNSITGTAHRTDVFARVSNAAFSHGVGVRLLNSQLSIVRRVLGIDTVMEPDCGAFTVGDTVRLAGVGDVHTLRRNGTVVGVWNDIGHTAARGSDNRSIGVRVDGSKDALGPRRFSPAIDWIEAG